MEPFDLDAAVRAGVLRSDQADALRRFDEQQRNAPSATEERFRFISGFADVMAAVGILMVIGTLIAMIGSVQPAACVLIPLACWWAATYFAAKRRLMLSSFVIFASFALTSAMTALAIGAFGQGLNPWSLGANEIAAAAYVFTAGVTTVACYAWWRRFQLPIAFATFAVALVNVGMNAFRTLFPDLSSAGVDMLAAVCGPALFAWAMWWDISDVRRETIRSDVAFWLHVAAGFLMVKSAMTILLGKEGGTEGWGRMFTQVADPSRGEAGAVLLLFLLFAVVALIIDRRSLLTAGMFYAVPAAGSLIGSSGVTPIGPALLLCGVTLTVLAVRWTSIRELLLRLLPDSLVAQLPRPQLNAVGPRPVY